MSPDGKIIPVSQGIINSENGENGAEQGLGSCDTEGSVLAPPFP